MSKTLEACSVWFGVTITKAMKLVGLRERIVHFSDWNWKILVWLKHIFIQMYMFLRVWYFTDSVSKGTNIKCMKKTTLGNAVPVSWYISYLLLNLWKHFVFMSWFYVWNYATMLGNWFFIYKFDTVIYMYIPAICLAT